MISYLIHYKDGSEVSGFVANFDDVEKFLDENVVWITAAMENFSYVYSWEWRVCDEESVFCRFPVIEDNISALF